MASSTSSSVIPSSWATPTSVLLDGLDPTLSYTWAGVACLTLCILYISTRPKSPYDTIPAVGRTGYISSYLDARQYTRGGKDLIMEGYAKYKHGIFRIPEMSRWHILVSTPRHVNDLRKAPEDVLSFLEAVKDTLPTGRTLGKPLGTNQYHVSVIRNQLTRNLPNVFSDLRHEIMLAFDENIPVTEQWTKVKAYPTVMGIVSRASNRIFVGAPLCRDPDYLALNVKFSIDVISGGDTINKFPNFLKPFASHLFTNVPQSLGITLKYLKPIIEERLEKMEQYGLEYPEKPLDLISWLLDEAPSDECKPEKITYRILMLNFAAIHTSSISFTGALFDLASRPEYIEPIRHEVEAVVAELGWTKVAMARMRKLDSFLKESQRMKGVSSLSMMRRALKEFTFSDGTSLPKGAFVSVVSTPRHLDEEVYANANTFNGFRFSDMREEEGEGTKNQMVATSTDFLTFGHGKHACPGRFFAVNELKAMMAHVVLTYDLKMTDIPRYKHFGASNIPDANTEVWFRKRRA